VFAFPRGGLTEWEGALALRKLLNSPVIYWIIWRAASKLRSKRTMNARSLECEICWQQLSRELWPGRETHPTLYSTRHEAIAQWKNFYLHPGQTAEEREHGLAMIAALCGHATASIKSIEDDAWLANLSSPDLSPWD
jgi:hypothetical protein